MARRTRVASTTSDQPTTTDVPRRSATRRQPMDSDTALAPVQCQGCGVTIGFSPNPHYRLWCSRWCTRYPTVDTRTEQRDHWIENLVARGASTAKLSAFFGLTRQRVQQIYRRRVAA